MLRRRSVSPDAVPQLMLLHYGDHPVIEPGELYLLVIPGQDGATRDAWMAEHFDHLAAQVLSDGAVRPYDLRRRGCPLPLR
jgi:hypothetical protein